MLHPQLTPPLLQEKSSSCISLTVIKPQASGKDGVAQGLRTTLEDILVLGLSQNYCETPVSSNQRVKRINSLHHSSHKHLPAACSLPVFT